LGSYSYILTKKTLDGFPLGNNLVLFLFLRSKNNNKVKTTTRLSRAKHLLDKNYVFVSRGLSADAFKIFDFNSEALDCNPIT